MNDDNQAFISSWFTVHGLRLFRSTLGGARYPQLGGGVRGERVGLAVGGERARSHVVGVARDGVRYGRAKVCVLAHEARACAAEGEAEQVVRDENLRVAVRARADAYGRNVQRLQIGRASCRERV